MKLCAVVVTYYPDVEDAIKNIMQYLPWVDHLVIWENTPSEYINNYRIELPEYADKISYMGTGKNEGIAFALNRTVEYAQAHGYTHLLTMDQDSYWEDFRQYKNNVDNYIDQYSIFAPNINKTFPGTGITERKVSITSGSIYSIDLFNKIGLFREEFFIDAVDTEMGYRAFSSGIPTITILSSNLIQQFGESAEFLGKPYTVYSPFRTYHIIRNHIWLWRMYPAVIDYELKKAIIANYILKKIIYAIIKGTHKFKNLKSVFNGIIDGIFRRINI